MVEIQKHNVDWKLQIAEYIEYSSIGIKLKNMPTK